MSKTVTQTAACRKTIVLKWLFVMTCFLLSAIQAFSQVGISNTVITPDASSVLELKSTTTGFLPPRMTTAQRDFITTPATGLLVYNTTTSQLNSYNGSSWIALATGSVISSLNTLTGAIQSFATGTGGTDITISSAANTHTFNFPIASTTNTGKLSNTDWVTFNSKQSAFTNSAGLASILSDETGTGLSVFSTSPVLTTPILGVASSTSGTITGTAGAGFLELQRQSSAPATGVLNSVRLFSNNSGALAWKRSDGFIHNFASTITADRTFTFPDASGTVPVSASGNIALSAAGNITFSGTLPVANGGTNSSAALNNSRIMVSSGGAVTEAAALTNGQLLIGSTGAAPVAATLTAGNGIVITDSAGSITVKSEPTITESTASGSITTASTGYIALSTPLTITPGAGDYLVFFNAMAGSTKADCQVFFSIYQNGTQITTSETAYWVPTQNAISSVMTTAYITNLGAGEAIDVRWRVANAQGGTGRVTTRALRVQKVK